MEYNISAKNRFLSRVQIPDNDVDCWMWKGIKFPSGYGAFFFKNNNRRAHRVSFELFVGPIPKGMCVCHSCDNPSCVNPRHLFLGTPKDNMIDKILKGRQVKGEQQPGHKLTNANVIDIKKMLDEGISITKISKTFRVDRKAIYFIKSGKHWAHTHE